MAGKRHHIIPQFLLKGFVSPSHGNKKFVWVFWRDKDPIHTNIINVGVESNFYKHDDMEADSAITKVEPRFSNLLDKIRLGEKDALTSPDLSEIIAHFEMRSKHLRYFLSQAGNLIMSRLSSALSDENELSRILSDTTLTNHPFLKGIIRDALSRQKLPEEKIQQAELIASSPGLGDQFRRLWKSVPNNVWDYLAGDEMRVEAEKAAQSGHVEAMQHSPVPQGRAYNYKHLTYSVIKKPGDVILGDTIVLFRINSETRYKAMLEEGDVLNAVYLPIDDETVLVGAGQRESALPDDFSEAVASCSLEYFVASENTETNRSLQREIGTNTVTFAER